MRQTTNFIDQKASISKNLTSLETSNQDLKKDTEFKNDLNELKQIIFKLQADMQDDSSSESSDQSINKFLIFLNIYTYFVTV